MKKNSKVLTIIGIFLMLTLWIVPLEKTEYVFAASSKGSLTISLSSLESSKENVAFKVYKVGEWTKGSWTLAECLSDTGISLDSLKGASQWKEAAATLSTHKALDTLASVSGQTDANGSLTFSNLEWGMYLVVQAGDNQAVTVSPGLVALPYVVDGAQQGDRTIYPKATLNETGSGSESGTGIGSESGSENGSGTGAGSESGSENGSANGSSTDTENNTGSGVGNEAGAGNSASNAVSQEPAAEPEKSEPEEPETTPEDTQVSAEEPGASAESTETNETDDSTQTKENGSVSAATVAVMATAATAAVGAAGFVRFRKFKKHK